MDKEERAAAIANAPAGKAARPSRLPVRTSLATGVSVALVACGGGGGSAPPPPPKPVSVAGVSDARTGQGITGEALLAFRVALVENVVYPVEVKYSLSAPGGMSAGASCADGADYYVSPAAGVSAATANSGTLTIADAGASRQLNLMVCPGSAAADQALVLGWADGSPSGTGNATGTIRGAGSGTPAGSITLNDTGITGCASMTQNGLACPQAGLPGQ